MHWTVTRRFRGGLRRRMFPAAGSTILSAVLLLTASVPVRADVPEVPVPNLYVSPTVGVWGWDGASFSHRTEPADSHRLVYGGRLGYSLLEALSGELVFLTGTNRVADFVADGFTGNDQVRLTQVEASFVVNFRSLVVSRWYPFVDLGSGLTLRSTDFKIDGESVFDGSHINFHLGGGVKLDLSPHATIRLNLRDTFFTRSETSGGQETQTTVDMVEFTGAVEFRIPLRRRGSSGRLR